MTEIYAENVNYWKSNSTAPDTWIEKSCKEIEAVGGKLLGTMSGVDHRTGKAAFMIAFSLDGQSFKLQWPVLKSKTGNDSAARRQAATALYHDVKARCVAAKFIGSRQAFFSFMQLPDGRTLSEIDNGGSLLSSLTLLLSSGD